MLSAKLTGYKYTGEEYGQINYIEVEWSRKWFECGNFTALIPASEYNSELKYLKLEGRPETGIIQKIVYSESIDGKLMTISGMFLNAALDWFQTILEYELTNKTDALNYLSKTIAACSTPKWWSGGQLDDTYKNSTYGDTLYSVDHTGWDNIPTTIDATITRGTGIGTSIYEILSIDPLLGYYCSLDIPQDKTIWYAHEARLGVKINYLKARDKSSLIFSNENGSISELTYTYDDSAAANIVRTALDIEPGDRFEDDFGVYWQQHAGNDEEAYLIINGSYSGKVNTGNDGKDTVVKYYTTTNNIQGFGKSSRVKFLNGSTEYDIKNDNYSKIRKSLQKQGHTEWINNYQVEEDVECKIIQTPDKKYLTDYDLGDVITVLVNMDTPVYFAKQITGITEVHSNGYCDIDITLGTGRVIKRG